MRKALKGTKILIGPSTFGETDRTPLYRLIEAGFEVIDNPYKRKLTKDELFKLLSDNVSGLIAGLEPIDREVLEKTGLKVISRCGSGLSNVDLETAKKLGIKVCYTPYGPTTAVAELTVGAMISLLRMVSLMDRDMHDGKWRKKIGMQLECKTIAIIGFGRIGRKVASLLKPFGVKICAVDPVLKGEVDGVNIIPLKAALQEANIITLHSSGDDQIIGNDEFKIMEQGTLLLNAARGGLIDEEALINALESERIAGAWLDTFSVEPYSGPLSRYPQVILTPHVGSYTAECRRDMEMQAVENLLNAFEELF